MAHSTDIEDKVLQYETFLNETLKKDLRKVLEERDRIYAEISEYLQLQNTITRMQETKLTEKPLKTKVDLGCNFYANAVVEDSSRIFVKIGFGFFLEFTLDEALNFISKKIKILEASAASLSKNSAEIKSKIKIVLEGLRELQFTDPVTTQEPS